MHKKIDLQARHNWRESRSRMEIMLGKDRRRSSVVGEIPRKSKLILKTLNVLLRLSGLYEIGERNARAFRIREVEFAFPNLPPAFDGYTILHLTDLHVGLPAGLFDDAMPRLSALSPDLVVLTGDYQTSGMPTADITAGEVSRLISAFDTVDGSLAILGNHDRSDMVEALEHQGIRVLINESVEISRGDDRLRIVGIDDVHAFYTSDASASLDEHSGGFRIALVHSVDLAGQAAANGYDLYLSGHSHGGQVCLPGGKPIMTGLDTHRHLAAGRWRLQDMQGYTNRGLGAQFPPVRFNCPGEAVMIRLTREISD